MNELTFRTEIMSNASTKDKVEGDLVEGDLGVFSHAFGEAHDQDLRKREIAIEGTVLLSKRRLMAMSKEAYLAGEADQKRVDLLASQKKKSELLLGHESEAKRQRQDAAAKKVGLFLDASARKARSLKMQQLQETDELALALKQGAGDRAPAFAREITFLQREQIEQREFIKVIQSRRGLNLELRQAAAHSTKKDIDARFLKREQDREKQNLIEFGEREAEQLCSVQAMQLVQSQELFDQREHQQRSTTQVQATYLTQQQELRAHHLEMKRTAKLSMLVMMFQVKEAEREQASIIKAEKLLLAQGVEAKHLLNAQNDACESRSAARLLDETRAAIVASAERVSAIDGTMLRSREPEDHWDHLYSTSAQILLSAAMQQASELEASQEKERTVKEERQRDDEEQKLFRRKGEVAAEIEREKAMAAIAKRQMETDLGEMVRFFL